MLKHWDGSLLDWLSAGCSLDIRELKRMTIRTILKLACLLLIAATCRYFLLKAGRAHAEPEAQAESVEEVTSCSFGPIYAEDTDGIPHASDPDP